MLNSLHCVNPFVFKKKEVLGSVRDVWITDNNDYHGKHY